LNDVVRKVSVLEHSISNSAHLGSYAPTLIQINITSGLNIYKIVRKTELKSRSHFSSFKNMSYLIYTDLIISMLDPKLVDL